MTGKSQLAFILNPTEPLPTLSSISASSSSSNSIDGWSGEHTIFTSLLCTPCTSFVQRNRVEHEPPTKKPRTIFPSASSLTMLAYSSPNSPGTSSEGELSSDDVAAVANVTCTNPKKKTRLCKEKGCTSLAVSRRSCVRHGGGSRCTYEGCTNGAKLRNRCFQHGGSTICLAEDCNSKAKRYGYCWSHGGGRICSTEGCIKVAAQGGLCWAHGGGNRCRLEGCTKRSYQKHGYYCKAHAAYNQ